MRLSVRPLAALAALVLVPVGLVASLDTHAGVPVHRPTRQEAPAAGPLDAVSLHFEANRGQTHPSVRFVTRARGYTAFLLDREAVLVPRARSGDTVEPVRMRFRNARSVCRARGADSRPGKSHYFVGDDPEGWVRNVPSTLR